MSSIGFSVRGIPVGVNSAYFSAMRGRRHVKILTPEARAWKAAIAIMAQQSMRGLEPFRECQVTIRFYFPSRRHDIDGPEKLALDGLQDGGVFDVAASKPKKTAKRPQRGNDSWVMRKVTEKFIDADNPRLEVRVEAMMTLELARVLEIE